MKFYKFALWKAYFEKGYSILSYPKWIIGIFGIGEVINKNYWMVIGGAFLFFIICILIGWLWIKAGIFEAENEVGNQYNLFVKQMRRKI